MADKIIVNLSYLYYIQVSLEKITDSNFFLFSQVGFTTPFMGLFWDSRIL